MEVLEFFQQYGETLVMGLLFLCLIWFLIKFNLSNGDYKKFRLAEMVMTKEGYLDRRAIERLGLYLMSMYGFLVVLHKFPDQIVTYFWAMTGTWLTAHVANAVANKFPDRPRDGS